MTLRLALPLALVLGAPALAQEVDPAALYEVTTEGSTRELKVGEKGTFVLTIQPKAGAHVSGDTPLKLELSGKNVKLAKEKLTLADSVSKPGPGERYAIPRFEVPFAAEKSGEGAVDGKLTFFICTEKLCARQQKTLSSPIHISK